MIAALASRRREEQGTAEALRAVAIGVRELVGGVHAQPFGTQRDAITIALTLRMPVLVERDGGDAVAIDHHLIGVRHRKQHRR